MTNPPTNTPSNDELDDEQIIFMLLTIVRDAGALDDNNGAEDWSHSDKAIQYTTQNILDWANKKVIEALENVKGNVGQLKHSDVLDEVDKIIDSEIEALRKKG